MYFVVDLKEDLKNFELWLKEVESIVENLSIDGKWQLNEIELRLNEHIVIIFELLLFNLKFFPFVFFCLIIFFINNQMK